MWRIWWYFMMMMMIMHSWWWCTHYLTQGPSVIFKLPYLNHSIIGRLPFTCLLKLLTWNMYQNELNKVHVVNSLLCISTGDCVEFLSWFLNTMHSTLGGGKKISSSVIGRTFRGSMRVYTKKMPPIDMVRHQILC